MEQMAQMAFLMEDCLLEQDLSHDVEATSNSFLVIIKIAPNATATEAPLPLNTTQRCSDQPTETPSHVWKVYSLTMALGIHPVQHHHPELPPFFR